MPGEKGAPIYPDIASTENRSIHIMAKFYSILNIRREICGGCISIPVKRVSGETHREKGLQSCRVAQSNKDMSGFIDLLSHIFCFSENARGPDTL